MIIRELTIEDYDSSVPRLAEILIDAVHSGAGVTFLAPLSKAMAEAFWRKTSSSVGEGGTVQFVAEENGLIAGTVMLQKVWALNQQHRCEVAKLLVHRDFRRRNIGTLLMQALEAKARQSGFTLITFDTVAHGPTEAFYKGLGFTCAGYIPDYATTTQAGLHDTALFYKRLTRP
jgi:acetyltransferase